MSTKTTKLPLAKLVEDLELYPRHNVDAMHVQSLHEAIVSGKTLPPIVADQKSKRIIDGFHRVRAYRRALGENGTVEVELVAYKSEADMKRDAVCRNASHGRRLDAIDRVRSVIMLRSSGFDDPDIADALNVSVKAVEKYSIRVATTGLGADNGAVPGTSTITLKRSVAHMAGEKFTAEQSRAHSMMPGTTFDLIARQLRTAIDTKMIDLNDETVVGELKLLLVSLKRVVRSK